MAARRQAWFDGQPDLDPERLIFIDESGASTKMARLRGRARRGERCRAAVPHGHWKTTTFVGALRLRGMTAPMVLDGPMNGPAFLAYVEQVLAPTLAAGETVIMDTSPLLAGIGGVYLKDNDISPFDDEPRQLTAECIPSEAASHSIDPKDAERLWALSERLLAA